jgi:hypothetical protein
MNLTQNAKSGLIAQLLSSMSGILLQTLTSDFLRTSTSFSNTSVFDIVRIHTARITSDGNLFWGGSFAVLNACALFWVHRLSRKPLIKRCLQLLWQYAISISLQIVDFYKHKHTLYLDSCKQCSEFQLDSESDPWAVDASRKQNRVSISYMRYIKLSRLAWINAQFAVFKWRHFEYKGDTIVA